MNLEVKVYCKQCNTFLYKTVNTNNQEYLEQDCPYSCRKKDLVDHEV